MIISIQDVEFILAIFAATILLLDTSTRGYIISSHSKANRRAVGESYLVLHESLAKRATTDHKATVIILDSPGENLGGGCRILIDQHGDLAILETASAIACGE